MKADRQTRDGFSLVEVVIAVGVTSFCLLSIIGLLTVGLQGMRSTSQQTAAAGIGSDIIADIQATPAGSQSLQFKLSVPAAGNPATSQEILLNDLESTQITAAHPVLYRAEITITPPASAADRSATMASVLIAWPGQAALANAQGRWETVIGLDLN
jgi:uncharacterized protein (TIGR02598 family)